MIPNISNRLFNLTYLLFIITPSLSYAQATNLKNSGVTLGLSYEAGYQASPLGSDAGSSAKQRLSINAGVNLDRLAGMNGSSLFFQFQNHNGQHGVVNVGDIQQFDGLDDPEYDRIHMLWFQQLLLDGTLRLKIGKVDPKSEFFAPKNGADHFNTSTQRSPTIIAQGPPSMSINGFYQPNDSFSIGLGLYDASWLSGRDENTLRLHNPFKAEDFALFIESRFYWDNAAIPYPGEARLGMWQLGGDLVSFSGAIKDGSHGYYLSLDQAINDNGVGVYLQYGYADEDISAVKEHIGLGLRWQGPVDSRSEDVLGFGYSSASFSQAQGTPFRGVAETVYEIFYKAPLSPHLLLQADVQAIRDPGGIDAKDVVVTTLRATLSF